MMMASFLSDTTLAASISAQVPSISVSDARSAAPADIAASFGQPEGP